MKNQSIIYKLNNLQLFAEDDDHSTDDKDESEVEALKKLKASTVPKKKYEELEAKYKQALDAIIDGNSVETEIVDDNKKPTISELRSKLYGPGHKDMTNLEYVSNTLELRKQIMEQGGTDPFVPVGRKVKATYQDFETANSIADVLEECVKAADGDPVAFNNELRKRGL